MKGEMLVVLSLLGLGALPDLAAQRPQARRCLAEMISSERGFTRLETLPGNENVYAAGNVKLRCQRQNVFLGGDSVESLSGDYIALITRAYYRDDDISIDADTIKYLKPQELLQFRGNVTIVNRINGSTLTGPWVDYLRAVKEMGRDSAEMNALSRPRVEYKVDRVAGDTVDPAPYVIVGDLLKTFGSSRMFGHGNVTIDRDSLRGRGDSVKYFTGAEDAAVLYGAPARLERAGTDSFTVRGREVRLGVRNDSLRSVTAYGGGEVTSAGGDVRGDSVALGFDAGKLERTDAWDRATPARVRAQGYDVSGDSVVILSPGERLRELLVVGRGVLQQPVDSLPPTLPDSAFAADSTGVDSLPPIRNTITGGRITARFTDTDSAGTPVTRLQDIVAIGQATSLFSRQVERNGRSSPAINYTRADTITVVMKTGDSAGVAVVRAVGSVDGMQLEKASIQRNATPRGAARPGEGT